MRLTTRLSLLAVALLLQGCVAAVIPIAAAGGLVRSATRHPKPASPAIPQSAPTPLPSAQTAAATEPGFAAVAALPSAPASQTVSGFVPRPAAASPEASGAVRTQLTALPKPEAAQSVAIPLANRYQALGQFVHRQVDALKAGAVSDSVVLVPTPDLAQPAFLRCASPVPAVIVDLDDHRAVVRGVPAHVTAAPGFADALRDLRADGVRIAWVTDRAAARKASIRADLRMTGLDPEGRDPIFARTTPDRRKALLRQQVAQAFCVVAIVGDARTDFDELFEYLKRPELAFKLDRLTDAGWFLLPPPLAPATALPPTGDDHDLNR